MRPPRPALHRLPTLVIALALLTCPRPGVAQTDSAGSTSPGPAPAAIRWGKWAAAGLAVGFTALGLHQHDAANHAFGELVGYCGRSASCTLDSDGHYLDPVAEATYRRVVRGDRAARAWLITGQLTAVASAALFVLDLMRPHEPPNIPYAGLLVESGNGMTRVGIRVPVRVPTGR